MNRAILLLLPLLGCTATPAEPVREEQIDPVLAQHPQIGADYVKAFKAGVRIPARFRGEWSSDPTACGTEGDDMDTRLWIDAVTVGYYGETHVVTQVTGQGAQGITLAYAPPKQGYHSTVAPARLVLSADGQTLMQGEQRSGGWSRCPAAAD